MNSIIIHAAPLQGVTDCVWRNAHARIFGGIDYYHAPFMRVEHGECRPRDLRDIAPQNNTAPLVPQILGCKPEEALIMARTIQELGYRHIEINLGCPHPPVALKHKGSGLLAYPSELEQMCKCLGALSGITFSVKMRLGWDNDQQWKDALCAIAPLRPLHIVVHPRIGRQQYKGELLMTQWEHLLAESPYPVIYNGGITSRIQIDELIARYPSIKGVMIGRGLVSAPSILSKRNCVPSDYIVFHKELLDGYSERLSGGEHQLLTHMKTLWTYFLQDADRRLLKPIIKSRNLTQYSEACQHLFMRHFSQA